MTRFDSVEDWFSCEGGEKPEQKKFHSPIDIVSIGLYNDFADDMSVLRGVRRECQ